MQAFNHVPLVEVTRGEIVESVHYGAFCVVDREGRLLASAGDPDWLTYPRSSLKPLQALPFIEHGGAQAFGLSEEEIAILCASHAGTAQHVAVLQSMHEKIGLAAADLACGVHWPYDTKTREAMKLAGQEPTELNHNCSGKHTGMLAFARLRGYPTQNYLDLDHPVQVAIREILGEMAGLDPQQMPVGIDGCSAPVYGISMRKMAQAVAKLADPTQLATQRSEACRRITAAMMSFPFMVAGPDQFDTDLMTAAGDKVFSKSGAEGYLILGVMPGVIGDNSPGVGIAIKISDGDARGRARASVGLTLLMAMGVLTQGELDQLDAYGNVTIKNWRELPVGEVHPVFERPDFMKMRS
ncbi:MAG: asparaginase [Brevefilum sp.]